MLADGLEIFTVETVPCRRFGLFVGVGVVITSFWSWLVRKCGVVKGGVCEDGYRNARKWACQLLVTV